MIPEKTYYKIYKIFITFWLFGWFFKIEMFLENFRINRSIKLKFDFYIPTLENHIFAEIIYFLPIIIVFGYFLKNRFFHVASSLLMFGCSFLSLIHIQFYNDATFNTSLWAAIWLVYFCLSQIFPRGNSIQANIFLGRSTIALIFLGAATGKLTQAYYNGDAFFNIYITQKDYFIYNFLRNEFDIFYLKELSSIFSKILIFMELLIPFLSFLLPIKKLTGFLSFLFIGIIFFSTPYLISVFSCLFGLIFCLFKLNKFEEF